MDMTGLQFRYEEDPLQVKIKSYLWGDGLPPVPTSLHQMFCYLRDRDEERVPLSKATVEMLDHNYGHDPMGMIQALCNIYSQVSDDDFHSDLYTTSMSSILTGCWNSEFEHHLAIDVVCDFEGLEDKHPDKFDLKSVCQGDFPYEAMYDLVYRIRCECAHNPPHMWECSRFEVAMGAKAASKIHEQLLLYVGENDSNLEVDGKIFTTKGRDPELIMCDIMACGWTWDSERNRKWDGGEGRWSESWNGK